MPYHNISANINDDVMSGLTLKIKEISDALPFLVNLTPKEIQSLYKLGNRSLPFVEVAYRYASKNPELFPGYLQLEEFERDFSLFCNLKVLLELLKPLTEKLNDTYLAVGSETFSAARDFYYSLKRAAESGIPGCDSIARELGERFAQSTRKAENKEDQETDPATTH